MTETSWPALPVAQRLRVAIGSLDGQPVEVDLKSRSLGGIGAHGLITGVNQITRDDLLRTLLLGLVRTHGVPALNLLLLDPGTGAVFDGFQPAPQLSHLFTGAEAAGQAARALRAESARRAELLRERNMRTQHDYDRAWHYERWAEPMPPLLVVLNRFTQLRRQSPELGEVIKDEAAAWQSQGVHLLVVVDQVTDLPTGLHAYFGFELNARDTDLVHWPHGKDPITCQPLPVPDVLEAVTSLPAPDGVPQQLTLPPLRERMPLDVLFPPLTTTEERGLHLPGEPRLAPPVGVVDLPAENRRDRFRLNLSEGDGHALVVGDPGSGVDEVLHNAALSLALAGTPAQLQLYVLDLVGESLLPLRELPHTRAAACYQEANLVYHLTNDLAGLVDRREHERRAGTDPGEQAVVVLVHGWHTLRRYQAAYEAVWDLLHRGTAVNVHVLAGLHRWNELEAGVADCFSSRLELRLSAPHFSAVDPAKARELPGPGHGLTYQGEHFLAATPEFQDGGPPAEAISKAWTGERPKQLRPLPELVPLAEVPKDERWPLGVVEGELRGFGLGWKQHLVCFGDYRTGRTNVLRAVLKNLVAEHTEKEAVVAGIDPRRNFLGVVPEPWLLTYLTQPGQIQVPVSEIRESLVKRRDEGRGNGPELFLVIDDYEIAHSYGHLDALADLLPDAKRIGFHLVLAGKYLRRKDQLLSALDFNETLVLLLDGPSDTPDVVTGLTPWKLPKGQAQLWRNYKPTQIVQVGWVPED